MSATAIAVTIVGSTIACMPHTSNPPASKNAYPFCTTMPASEVMNIGTAQDLLTFRICKP